MVTKKSVLSCESAAPAFDNHEDVIGHIVLGRQPKLRRRHKAKSWVILRVPEQRDYGSAELPAFVEPRMHESGANALPLSVCRNCHRCETHNFKLAIRIQRHWREQNVPNNRAVVIRDQRDDWRC